MSNCLVRQEMDYIPLQKKHTQEVAGLHITGISTGFISSLGIDFVTSLYEAIAQSKSSFGFVAEENDSVIGFIAFTTNLNKLYKAVILRKGLHFVFLLGGKILSLKRIKNVFETLFYPSRIKKMDLPSAELLSIVIAEKEQGKGLAIQLLKKAFEECQKRGIESVKVMVSADNENANRLYQKCGFERAGQINNHGVLSNIYVAKTR